MIEYKHKQELEILKHYADKLDNHVVKDFLASKSVSTDEQVKIIADFYWQVVDLSTEEDKKGIGQYEDMDVWLERIYTSLHIYFGNQGYDDVWNQKIP